MIDMGMTPTSSVTNQARAQLVVQFLRGGVSPNGSRDEVLNDPSIKPPTILLPIGPNAGQMQKYSYFYQDDPAAPGDPPNLKTDDDGTPPAGYPHKLGDIFHSEPLLLDTPQFYPYLASNLTPGGPGTAYIDFANLHAKRRKVVFVGSNDGFLHAFDSGVWGRDTANFPTSHDLGTGREIFAYSPRIVMNGKFPSLLSFPPLPQYFVDGSMGTADVFIDPINDGVTPNPSDRVWRTVLVGGLRQGGAGYYALDVTQPDDIVTTVGPTLGEISGNKDASPGCLTGTGGSCAAGSAVNRKYPEILWEYDDTAAVPCSDSCTSTSTDAPMGETWSRPVLGRIRIIADPTPPVTYQDRYVAIFGGGFDPSFTAGDSVTAKLPNGRALYIVDVETGKLLYKTSEGVAGDNSTGTFPPPVPFAPMPAPIGLIDYDDDGYLDTAFAGDVNGNMWRIDLTPDVNSGRGVLDTTDLQVHGYQPFMLFNGCGTATGAGPCPNQQPIFFEPTLVFMGGGVAPPTLGVAWGTGNRAELARPNVQAAGLYYVIDSGQMALTYTHSSSGTLATDIRDLTPGKSGALGPCPSPFDPNTCVNGATPAQRAPGFVLDFGSLNEKTTSTVFDTLGDLSVVTFTPDSVSPCATNGSSYEYGFFFLTGQGAYNRTDTSYAAYRSALGEGVATRGQSTTIEGTHNRYFFSGREDQNTDDLFKQGTVRTIQTNWKEQQ
jgi:Tfp pilus tip-associated adhesin PilY1